MLSKSSRRRMKQKEKLVNGERSKALLSPDSLPIVYTDLRSKAVETKPLAEFLAWAKEEKVLVFTQAYLDFLFSKPQLMVGNVKLLCPFIERSRDCTSRNGITEVASGLYADRNSLFVDNMHRDIYQKGVSIIHRRQKAFMTECELLESEAACSESNKKVSEGSGIECQITEGQTDVLECILDEGVVQTVCEQDAKECISNDAEAKVVEGEINKGYAQDCFNVDNGIFSEEGHTEEVVDGDSSKGKKQEGDDAVWLSFEDWLLQLGEEKRKEVDTLFIQLLKSSKALEKSMHALCANVSMLRNEMKSFRKGVCDNGEAIVRVSLGHYLQEMWRPCSTKISVPTFGRKLPFVYFEPLEDLAKLCLTDARKSRSVPTDVEIDIFVKVVENTERKTMYAPPKAPYRVIDELPTEHGFTSFITGENTRSRFICNDAYSHPLEAGYSPCTKLLYKFIQVERALIATREYYYVGEDYMEAGLIVSPSFKNISNAHELIDQVLAGRAHAFSNIVHLHAKGMMWLTSM